MRRTAAKVYLKAGLNPVPLPLGGKVPIRKNWGLPIGDEVDDYNFDDIGVCTGAISGGLEGLDFDLKYAENPDKLWEDWKARIPKNLLAKMTVSTTANNGYHLLYRTDVIEGNRKLAMNKDKEVLIETRGEGGYLKCSPSDGYEVIFGDLERIQSISNQERAILFSTSALFDSSLVKKKKDYGNNEYKDPFPKYNSDPDIGIELLEKHGWTIVREDDKWVELVRPGKTEGISAGYNLEGNFLYVFTTSTDFETERPYSNSAIFCMLEADGDYRVGYAKLGELGYGTKEAEAKGVETKVEVEKDYDDEIATLGFLSKSGEDEEKLVQSIEGTIPLGLSYGWEDLDEYILFKENTLNFILAFEGVGKTYMELHKLVSLSVLYGKKFAVACGENEVWATKRTLIEAVSGKDIEYFKGKMPEYNKYKDFISSHFFVFKNETHYTVEDILKRAEVLKDKFNIDGLLVDPFSYFKRPLTNVYSYNDDLLSKLNIFSKHVCAIFMTVHPTTDATRAPRDQEGYLKPPTQYDAIGGNIFANRSDHFMVYHMIRNHSIPAMRTVMELRQYKVKDEKTGGSVTPIDKCISLTFKTVNGFKGYFDSQGNNPMYEKYKARNPEKLDKVPLPSIQPTPDIF